MYVQLCMHILLQLLNIKYTFIILYLNIDYNP